MNIMPSNSIVVVDIVGDFIKTRVLGSKQMRMLEGLGFVYSDAFMLKKASGESEKIQIIDKLVKEDALFMFGYGWYPSEVMAYYKENGVYSGKYKVISWLDKDNYRIEEK